MRVFVTGATGFIGSAIVPELINAGHQVLGLARSDASATALATAGAQAHRGTLEDLESLRSGAAEADAVIHVGFIHDFARFAENCEIDRLAIEAMGEVLVDSDRPFIVTSGVGATPGRHRTEEDAPEPPTPHIPRVSEHAAAAAEAKGVDVRIVRLPQVHDEAKQGFVSFAIPMAREKGISIYVGDGLNRIPAVHQLDAARLYRLALEKGAKGARYHAIAEEAVPVREIAEAMGRGLNIPTASMTPEEVTAIYAWLAPFWGADMPASSTITQEQLGWKPTGPGLIADLDNMQYS